MTREEILDCYRRLRALCRQHMNAAISLVAQPTLLEHARRLGLAVGKTLVANNESELTLAFDLALFTAKEGRSRGLDRYARSLRLEPGSEEARVLDTIREARFSLWRVERLHETVGLVISDVLCQTEEWLVDEQLEATAKTGVVFAARIFEPERFTMTCGTVLPMTRHILETVTKDNLAWRKGRPERIAQDPRFATAVYQAAIDVGVMDNAVDE